MVTPRAQVEELIAEVRQAVEANRSTPTRDGNVIKIEHPDSDVMVTADLHGNRVNYERLCQLADLENHPHRHLVMQEVCHGGPLYPSGAGCMSHLLLEDVARLKARFPERFHFVLSNHELAEWTDYPISKAGRMLNLSFRCGLREMYGDAAERVRATLNSFIASCPLAVRVSDVFICHSLPASVLQDGFDPTVLQRPYTAADVLPPGSIFRLVWGRDFGLSNATAFADIVDASVLIHGHEPCPAGFSLPNEKQLILDCCHRPASYVTIPANESLAHADVVRRIQIIN